MTFPTLEFVGHSHFSFATAVEVIKGQDYREITIRITDLFWKRITFRADFPKLIAATVVDQTGKAMYTINQTSLEVWVARALGTYAAYRAIKMLWIF